jgi:hypothetical protein
MSMVQLALNRKHMVMFSDFALKALIGDWSEQHLGPNPFLNIGTYRCPHTNDNKHKKEKKKNKATNKIKNIKY